MMKLKIRDTERDVSLEVDYPDFISFKTALDVLGLVPFNEDEHIVLKGDPKITVYTPELIKASITVLALAVLGSDKSDKQEHAIDVVQEHLMNTVWRTE
ncbi:MAG: hypothetical protein ACW99U_21485 [Candidatus Thorarchaeota archaeon]|jgi:hypothetical protein